MPNLQRLVGYRTFMSKQLPILQVEAFAVELWAVGMNLTDYPLGGSLDIGAPRSPFSEGLAALGVGVIKPRR